MNERCNVIDRSDGFDFRVVNSDKCCNQPSAGRGIWMDPSSMTTVYPCAKHLAALMEYPVDDPRCSRFHLLWADSVEPKALSRSEKDGEL